MDYRVIRQQNGFVYFVALVTKGVWLGWTSLAFLLSNRVAFWDGFTIYTEHMGYEWTV